jgi:peptide chain release factor subunit 1
MDTRKEYDVKKRVHELREMKGHGTELISVYIPEGYNIAEISNKLRDEYGQASNIKSKSTQKHVQSAISKILEYLKLFRKPPKGGIAVFCGNIITEEYKEGKIDLVAIQPPMPIEVQLYRCDSEFFLEPIERMLEVKETYGIIVIDKREATAAVLKGTRVEILRRTGSTIPGKTRAGGQSSHRFERLREAATNDFFNKVGDIANENFSDPKIKGIIVGGPGSTKFDFINGSYMHSEVKKKIIGSVDTGYTNEHGIKEALEKGEDLLAQQDIIKEKKILDHFMREAISGKLAVYGYDEVKEFLTKGMVEALLVSEGVTLKWYKISCKTCNKEREGIFKEVPHCECGKETDVVEEKDVINDLLDEAERQGVRIAFLSPDTAPGAQFKNGFGGIGALLRYR